ncbi:galactokinase [Agrococcus sp. UYP10]|uniref:galactokinase n=1 Tax=Agrococcus sp. UYP10 TaxID=1756355 RepID=UPI00339261C7
MRDAFAAAFGAEPDGIWSAPGRVNLIGEHTDYNGGLALPFGIDRRTRVAVRLRDDDVVRVATDSAQAQADDGGGIVTATLATAGEATGWSRYLLGVVHVLRRERAVEGVGFDALVSSDVPVGVGVSSSAALESAALVALDELWGLGIPRGEMVRLGQLVENEVVGAPTGTLDQSAVLLAERDHAVLLDFRADTAEQVPLGFEAAGLEILVIDSLVRHDHATGGYGERRRECEEAARIAGVPTLREIAVDDVEAWADRMPAHVHRRMRHIVTDTDRAARVAALVRDGRPREIGPILTDGHVSQRDDFEDSVPAIDAAVEAALAAGSLGARLTGGGFGGAAIALVDAAESARIGAEVADAVEAAGHARPVAFTVRASQGARRDPDA